MSKSNTGDMADDELRTQLKNYGVTVGPITATTRSVYVKKLEKLRAGGNKSMSKSAIFSPAEKRNGHQSDEEIPIASAASRSQRSKNSSSTTTTATAPKPANLSFSGISLSTISPPSDPIARTSPSIIPGLVNKPVSPKPKQKEEPFIAPQKSTIGAKTDQGTSLFSHKFSSENYQHDTNTNISSRRSTYLTDVSSKDAEYRRPLLSSNYGGGAARTNNYSSIGSSSNMYENREFSNPPPKSSYDVIGKDAVNKKWNSVRDTAYRKIVETAANFGFHDGEGARERKPTASQENQKFTSGFSSSYTQPRENKYAYGGNYGANFNTGTGIRRRRWWSLTANASRILLIMLAVFMTVLIKGYVGVVYKSKVRYFFLVLSGAVADTAIFVYNHMILPLLLIAAVAGCIFGVLWYRKYKKNKSAQEQRQIFAMVEKILSLLKNNYEECLVDKSRQPYLAVPHVRDMLIPPAQRRQLLPLWNKAVQYLNENESRVRTENQIISGEEFMVWRWVNSTNSNANLGKKMWQGHAIPEEQAPMNVPALPLYECLKLRGLFVPEDETDDEWPAHIQDAVLEKLGPTIRVLHLAVDTESPEGCVYLKMATKDEAGNAYSILHGSWFNGRLVNAKYMTMERYHARFPEAARAAFPLGVQTPRHSLLI